MDRKVLLTEILSLPSADKKVNAILDNAPGAQLVEKNLYNRFGPVTSLTFPERLKGYCNSFPKDQQSAEIDKLLWSAFSPLTDGDLSEKENRLKESATVKAVRKSVEEKIDA